MSGPPGYYPPGHPLPGYPPPGYQPGYPPQVYPPPQHTAQAYMSPGYPKVMQPVQIHPVLGHPAPGTIVTETWTTPGKLLPLPRCAPRGQRSEHEESEAYDYYCPQSKPKDHSRTYDQHRARLEQPLHREKAIEYQAQKQLDDHAYYSDDSTAVYSSSDSCSDTLVERRKETKHPTRSQQVHTKGDSSKRVHAQQYIESRPESADKQAKGISANPTRTERKQKTNKSTSSQRVQTRGDSKDHGNTQRYIESRPDGTAKQAKGSLVNSAGNERKQTTRKPTSVPHPQTDSKRRPEKPGEQAKERTSTDTTDTRRAHTTAHSFSKRSSIQLSESQSRVTITTDELEGDLNLKYDPKRGKFGTSTPTEKSTGHHSKEKAKGSSRVSQSKKPTKGEVPNYYATTDCSDDDVEAISRQIKEKKGKVYPERRVKRDASEQRLAEMNEESGEANAAADVPWHMAYRKGKDGKPVPR